MADDERRVEPRQVLLGRGMGATPERIAELQQRALEMEKLSRAKPARSFSEVMDGSEIEELEEELSDKEKRLRALPKAAPRPGLVHPSQRDGYRDEEANDPIILKG